MAGMNSTAILVTGATGNLGRAVVEALRKNGFKVKAGSTNPQKTAWPPGVQAVKVVYEDPNTTDEALKGTQGIFLLAPPLDPDAPAKLIPVIDKAKSSFVGHIVFVSALGVDQNEHAPLRIIERHLMASGMSHTILRANFFMENFSTGFIAPMIAQGGIFLAAGDGKTSFISTADIADTAAQAFKTGSTGMEYNLTGPNALDHTEVAQILSDVSGKDIKYFSLTEEAMLKGARDNGMPEGAVQYLATLYSVVRNGWAATITEDVLRVTGKDPIPFAEFARKNASVWK